MKNKYKYIVGVLILFLILISFGISFYNDKIFDVKNNEIKEEVLSYLKDKYNEEFSIIDFTYERNSYEVEEDGELVTKEMNDSYIYTLKVSSARLVEFDVIYIVYEDIDEYNTYEQYDIKKAGIYENYLYEYKLKMIKKEIKNSVYGMISDVTEFSVYIDYFDEDTILIDYSLDSDLKKEVYDAYRSLNKNVSNKEWFEACLKINDGYALTLDIDVNKYINNSNLEDFKEEVKDLVSYLEELGYSNYDINFSFKNYTSGRATRYLEDSSEKIYLIFAYVENYSNVEDEDKLYAYIIDK